jgi:hypothetical protein
MPKEMVPFPSGLKWGSKELDRIGFEVQSRQHPRRDFPWTNFFQETRIDPTEEISSDIEALFRLEAIQGSPINTVETRASYGALKQLQGQFIAPKSPNVRRIRSTAVDSLSSSPLFLHPLQDVRLPKLYPMENYHLKSISSNLPHFRPSQIDQRVLLKYPTSSIAHIINYLVRRARGQNLNKLHLQHMQTEGAHVWKIESLNCGLRSKVQQEQAKIRHRL